MSEEDNSLIIHDESDDLGADQILDRDNPKSVYNMVPRTVQRGIDRIPQEFWDLEPDNMETMFRDIGEIDRKLRQSFWYEYDVAHKGNRPMVMTNVMRGICSRNLFTQTILNRPQRLRYILAPPEDYSVSIKELLSRGMKELGKILDADLYITDKDGNRFADAKLAAVKLKTVEMLYNRLQGMPVHRSMQITENVNRNYNTITPAQSSVPDFSQINDVERLERIVQQLEGSSRPVMDIIPERNETVGAKDGQWVGIIDDDPKGSHG